MEEEWRPVVRYEGWYEVSDQGNVRSIPRIVTNSLGRRRPYPGKSRKKRPDKDGYLKVMLYRNGECKFPFVHRMVAEAFIGAIPDGHVVMHLDDNPQNNCVSNLRIATQEENFADMFSKGRGKRGDYQKEKTHCPAGHEYIPENIPENKKKLRRRCCRSCMNARSYIRTKMKQGIDISKHFQEISDNYFEKYQREGRK